MNREGRKPSDGLRPYELAARTRAFTAARLAITENITLYEAAERSGAKQPTVQEAITVLRWGTAEEITDAETGKVSMRDICDSIRKRTTPEERRGGLRKAVKQPKVRGDREVDVEVFSRLKAALEALTSMPVPADVVAIMKKHRMRVETVNNKILPAHTWLEEFISAWTEQ
jgi:hypothetical protein